MTDIKGLPYAEVTFDKDGNGSGVPEVSADTTDLIVVSLQASNVLQECARRLPADHGT